MENKLYQVNNFILVKRMTKALNLPPHLAGNKDNIDKIGVYRVVDNDSLRCLNFLIPPSEQDESGYYIVYVDNYSVLTFNKFNKEHILVPNSSVVLVEFVCSENEG